MRKAGAASRLLRALFRSSLRILLAHPPRIVSQLLTLTTDFGTHDAYVAAMKGVILSLSPALRLIDVTHEISPQDVMEAAFVLREAIQYFPSETVHLVVVDPGVGTDRRAVALRHHGHWFVGPDNGLFALLLETTTPEALVVLDRPAFWRTPAPSDTFHGRDIFAPVAAHLALGRRLDEVGSPRESLKPLHWALPIADEQGVQGWVVHIDRFGNCITNLPRETLEDKRRGRALKGYVGTSVIGGLQATYGAVAGGEPLLLFGSSGFLEVAVNGGNASALLDIRKGTPVNVVFNEPS